MSSSVNLYAEFLLNICQVTIYASLTNDRNEDPNAYITSDRKSLTISHDGSSATIIFPSGISGKATIEFPVAKSTTISLRLEITEDDKPSHGIGMEVANDGPWSARTLGPRSQVACRSCATEVLMPMKREWQDLPRDDWAEMMDLWHCHKPNENVTVHHETANKGYAAANRPKVRAGIAFVDICHLILPYAECSNLRIDSNEISCSGCGASLGVVDAAFDGIRLFKWSIAVRREQDLDWEKNLVQNLVCAQLLGLIDSQATRTFVVYSGRLEASTAGLLLWVFNPDLKYSASYLSGGRPRRAMKVLFKEATMPLALLDERSSTEELCLPAFVLEQLRKDLGASNKMLPERAQELQSWRVGLLDRFDDLSADQGSGVDATGEWEG